MEKYHKQEVSPVEEENERDETFEADNPQIDSERTKDNYHMSFNTLSYTEFINKRLNELGLRPRKDAVVMNSFVVGSDKTFFDGLSKIQRYSFFSDCTKFFEVRYGQENVMSAVVHLDETTPHMHLNLIPITPDGRLCSKDLYFILSIKLPFYFSTIYFFTLYGFYISSPRCKYRCRDK